MEEKTEKIGKAHKHFFPPVNISPHPAWMLPKPETLQMCHVKAKLNLILPTSGWRPGNGKNRIFKMGDLETFCTAWYVT